MEAPETDEEAILRERNSPSAPFIPKSSSSLRGTRTAQCNFGKQFLFCFILSFAIWGLFDAGRALFSLVNDMASLQTCDVCGDTPEGALSRGCRYHRVINAWVPEECYDEEIVSEFDEASKAWSFYEDQQGTIQIPYDQIPFYRGPKYTTWEQHVTHCYYHWLLHYRGFALGKAKLLVETEDGAEDHIRHCGKAFTNVPDEWKHKILTVLVGKNTTKD